MRNRTIQTTATTAVVGLAALVSSMSAAPAVQAATPGPTLRLIAAQSTITITKSGNNEVSVDPGIWLASVGSDLRLDVQRASLTKRMTITQLIKSPSGAINRRPLPRTVLDGWDGLKYFFRFSVRDSRGKLVISLPITFCPDSSNPQRTSPGSPPTSPYPQQCDTFDPFQLASIWGIEKGWAVDPAQTSSLPELPLALGQYTVTEAITKRYTSLFRIPADLATATVKLRVISSKHSSGAMSRGIASAHHTPPAQLAPPPNVPGLPHPPRTALPDLIAQPSWGISVAHTRSGQDLLNFGATVWIGGHGPLDVQGFRVPDSPVMKAYQYFWRDGHIIGRAKAGTMGFAGYNHWHFRQFAAYRLLNASKKLVLHSHKEGFCIAPTDSVNLLLPHAIWQPSVIGLGGQCGVATALWVEEDLPIGWGDTYDQDVPGQAFDITNVPNGVYYIEIIANPLHELHELTDSNNISVRKVILGGRPGHRTVRVPAWHGIDPES